MSAEDTKMTLSVNDNEDEEYTEQRTPDGYLESVTNSDDLFENLQLLMSKDNAPTISTLLSFVSRSIPMNIIDRFWINVKRQSS